MALSKCKECGKDVSDKAALCPHCGVPLPSLSEGQIENINKQVNGQMANIQRQSAFAQSRWLGGTAFFCGLAWLFLVTKTGDSDSLSQAWDVAKWPILGGVAWYIIAEFDRNMYERKVKKAEAKHDGDR